MDEFVRNSLVPLHQGRMAVAVDEALRKALTDAFNAEHTDLWERMASRKESKDRLEEQVRKDAVSLYHTIPNASKTFLLGVTIRETKKIDYNPEAALDWAKQHGMALKLDETIYKKQVEFGGAPGSISTQTAAAIARDLAPIIAAAEEADGQSPMS